MLKTTIFLLCHLIFAESALKYIKTFSMYDSVHNYTQDLFSVDFREQNIMSLRLGYNNTFGSVSVDRLVAASVAGIDMTYRIRSHYTNKGNFTSDKYIFYNQNSVVIKYKSCTLYESVYNLTNPLTTKIIESCFGQSINETFVLLKINNTLNNSCYYQILYFQGPLLNNTINIPLSGIYQLDRMLYKNGKLFILFRSMIYIYSANSSLILLQKIPLNILTVNQMDITIGNDTFCYSQNMTIHMLNSSTFRYIWNISLNSTIVGIQIFSNYIFATTTSKIYQIDYQIRQIIHFCSLHQVGINFLVQYCAHNQLLYLYKRQNETNSNLSQYLWDGSYTNLTNQSCYPTYDFNSNLSMCLKNYTLPYLINNGSAKITHDLSRTNPDYLNFFDSAGVLLFVNIIGKGMTFSSMRITPTFLLSLTGFLDDLWFYKYHRYKYPQSLNFFMQEVDIINELRLGPWFMDFISIIRKSMISVDENEFQHSYMRFSNSDPQQVYFLYSAEDTYKSNLIMNLFFLLVLKAILFLLMKINKITKYYSFKLQWINIIIQTLQNNTKWWILINAVVESNMLKLTFDCFTQILQPSHFRLHNKFNFFFAIISLFILFMYCIIYYPLIYSFNQKRSSSVLLTKSYFCLSSFYFESIFIVSRKFVKAFIHSFFIGNYSSQIILLTVVDAVIIIFGLKMFKCFKHKVIGIFCSFYALIFFIFDMFFVVCYHNWSKSVQNFDKQLISFIIAIALAAVALLISLIFLIYVISHLIKKLYVKIIKNKILNFNNEIKMKESQKNKNSKENSNNNLENNNFAIRNADLDKYYSENGQKITNMQLQNIQKFNQEVLKQHSHQNNKTSDAFKDLGSNTPKKQNCRTINLNNHKQIQDSEYLNKLQQYKTGVMKTNLKTQIPLNKENCDSNISMIHRNQAYRNYLAYKKTNKPSKGSNSNKLFIKINTLNYQIGTTKSIGLSEKMKYQRENQSQNKSFQYIHDQNGTNIKGFQIKSEQMKNQDNNLHNSRAIGYQDKIKQTKLEVRMKQKYIK